MNEITTFWSSLVIGFLLSISEILPYIKQIESNGIIELIIKNLVQKSKKLPEIQPLLEENTTETTETTENLGNFNISQIGEINQTNNQDNREIYINSENVSLKFNTSSVKISFDVNENKETKSELKNENIKIE